VRAYDVPVRVATWNGQRYVLSMLGEAQWVRNLHAAVAGQLLVGRQVEPVVAPELQAEEKAALLVWYCQHPAYRLRARTALRADTANRTAAEVERLARQYPVFRLEPAGAPAQASRPTHRQRHRCRRRRNPYTVRNVDWLSPVSKYWPLSCTGAVPSS
jgi:hypothetical protein